MKWKIKGNEYEVELEGRSIFRPVDIPELEVFIARVTDSINSSTDVRVIVLETWFFVDFIIRKILFYVCSLSRYDSEDFDASYILLPNSFNECWEALKKLLNYQRKLPPAKPKRNYIYIEPSMVAFLAKKHQDLLDELNEIETEYIRQKYPNNYRNVLEEHDELELRENAEKICVRDEFLIKCCDKLDKNWFEKAKKLNEVRNKAAHCYNENEIYKKLGISNENGLKEVRKYCKSIIEQVCGLKIEEMEFGNGQTENAHAE